MGRPTAEDRRRDYLRVGAEIVAEFDPATAGQAPLDALADVKVADVAHRAGVTKGALYHIWGSQEDYRRDLLRHLLEVEEQAGIHEVRELVARSGADCDVEDLVNRVATSVFDRLKDDPVTLARFSFYSYAEDPDVNRSLSQGVDELEPHYRRYLVAAGRRIREPYSLRQLVVSANALLLGMIVRHRVSPVADVVIERDGSDWSLFAFGLVALMEHFTEPEGDVPAAQPRS